MSLTLEKIHRLRSKGFDKLYETHKPKWIEIVASGRKYAESFIKGDETIRPGDISEIIKNAVRVDPDFESHVKAKGLQQKYWVEYFSDYVLDQLYPSDVKG